MGQHRVAPLVPGTSGAVGLGQARLLRSLRARGDAEGHVVRELLAAVVEGHELLRGATPRERPRDQPIGDAGVLGQDGPVQVRADDAVVEHALAPVLAIVSGAVHERAAEGLLARAEDGAARVLIAMVEEGIIGTVIVKDMSRLGRDYLQVGMYTEMVFQTLISDSLPSTTVLTVTISRTVISHHS